jgi:hypothetical protein
MTFLSLVRQTTRNFDYLMKGDLGFPIFAPSSVLPL